MADAMDRVQQRVQEELARNLAEATKRNCLVSEFFCLSCGIAIPEERRRIVIGVERCVTCQELNELKSIHFKGKK